ncbi:site-specific integrase [Verrucomicrobiales bacterium]|nr:site-specific integrase [Verrucomicrobiales bacterium]
MAKLPDFAPVRTTINKNYKGGSEVYVINVPDKYSETGKRRRLTFPNRRLALEEQKRLKKNLRDFGTSAIKIAPDDAAQAKKATELLKGHDVTLVQIVTEWLERKKNEESSVFLSEAFVRALELRKNKRENTKKDFVRLSKKLPSSILKTLVINLSPEQCEKALNKTTKGIDTFNRYRRVLNAVINDAIKDGHANENPVARVRTKDKPKKEIRTLEVSQLKTVFSSCIDFRGRTPNSPDARDAGLAFAFLAFSGLRPEEFSRLEWKDVQTDERRNIAVRSSVSKTQLRRHVAIEKNLMAFINTIPAEKRTGKVAPLNWKRKKTEVLGEAGLKGEQDIFRHSYGSYLEPLVNVETLTSHMGHQHINTYLKYYKNARTKKEAKSYFAVSPRAWTHRIK